MMLGLGEMFVGFAIAIAIGYVAVRMIMHFSTE